MKKLGFILFVVSLFAATQIQAQTSVYVCSTNGSYGFCYGTGNIDTCAYKECIKYGGQSPYGILTVTTKGFGAIAIGKTAAGAQVIGASAGYSDREEAKTNAIEDAKSRGAVSARIDAVFEDK